MSIVAISTVTPIAAHREEVKEALLGHVDAVHENDEGTEVYALLENDDEFVIVSKWADQASLDTHSASAHSVQIIETLAGKVQRDPQTQFLNALPRGRAELAL